MPRKVIDVGLPQFAQPFSWAAMGGNVLFTTHGPVRRDGSVDTGSIDAQARLTLQNLKPAVEAAGGSLADVTQVLIYMTDIADMAAIDTVYREFFNAPYPNRASVGVNALVVLGMKIEIVAYAVIERPSY